MGKTTKLLIPLSIVVFIAAIYFLLIPSYRIYMSYKYNEEIVFTRSFVKYLLQGNTAEIKRMSTDDAHYLSSSKYLDEASMALRNIDISSMKLLRVSKNINDGIPYYYIEVYFEGDEDLYIVFGVEEKGNRALMDSLLFSESFLRY